MAEQVAILSLTASDDLAAIWALSQQAATEALMDLMPSVVDTWQTASASLTADWYDDLREDLEVPGRFTARVPDLGDNGAEELARWASEPINLDEPDFRLARSRAEGGLQRRITNASRETVMISTVEDPQAEGWQRVARSGGCKFCKMLASRGTVYSEKGSRFGSHDYCHCSAAPAFGGLELPVKPYKPSDRTITDADRARVRAWIRANT